ncbi:MAG: restriction endonuclease [Candidatus Hadarchaeaceae archaeon]
MIELTKEEILKRIRNFSFSLFESLVAELLEKLGYGKKSDGSIRVTGRSGDGGIDGECCLDKLGLHKVVFQAKKWTAPVGSREVRDFIGALDTSRVDRGIFITTSSFSNDAIETAKRSGKVKLIDGKTMASLMIECGLGVRKRSLDLPLIDEDYFAGLT